MARRRRRTVYGEPVEVLLDVLNALDPEGGVKAEESAAAPWPLPPAAQEEALVRALMRSEAALLRKPTGSRHSTVRPTSDARSR